MAPAAILTAVFGAAIYVYTYTFVLNNVNERTVPPDAAARFEAYTGLSYDVSSGFGVASATIVAQTNLYLRIAYGLHPDPVSRAPVSRIHGLDDQEP